MPDWLHRTDRLLLRSVPRSKLPEPEANYIETPDLSAVAGFPSIYWIVTGDIVTLMDQAARDAVDAAALSDELDAVADELTNLRTITRAFAEVVLDEVNVLRARAYGGLYRGSAVTVQSMPNNVFTKLVALTGSTTMATGGGVVSDSGAGEVVLPTSGDWQITWQVSFSGSNNSAYEFAVFGDGTRIPQTSGTRELGTGGSAGVGSVGAGGIVNVPAAGVAIDLRCGHAESGARDVTVERLQLSVVEVTDRVPRTLTQLRNAVRGKLT